MPAYLIVMREGPLQDPEAFAEYKRKNAEGRPAVPFKPVVVYGATQVLEGDAPDGTVILEFESVEKARSWYESPQYQAALPHRLRSGDWRAFIVEGFQGG